MFDHPRTVWYPANSRTGRPAGDPVVRSSSGSPRPALAIPLGTFTVHHIGAGSDWLDPGDTADELAGIERNHAIPVGKPNEYNSASDSESVTWEWAGRFLAAHSLGNNSWSWGHLTVLGLESPSDVLIDRLVAGIRRARSQCVVAGWLTATHEVRPHHAMPGASTGCPGTILTRPKVWAAIAAPLHLNQPPQEDPMTPRFFRVGSRLAVWVTTDGITAARVDLDQYKALGTPKVDVITKAQANRYGFVDTIDRGVVV